MSRMSGQSFIKITVPVLLCIFILTSGCFSIPEAGVYVDEKDNRSHIVPFFGEIKDTPTLTPTPILDENNTSAVSAQPPEEGLTFIDWIIIVVLLIVVAVLFLRLIKYIIDKVRLEDGVIR